MRALNRADRMGKGLYGMADVDALEARGIGLEEGILALLRAEAPVVQLRWKSGGAGPMLEAARLLVDLCREHGALGIVNDRVDIAAASGAAGVHLGQDDLPLGAARAQLPEGTLIGVSTHDLDQVAAALRAGADYIGYGPVFSTSTKARPDPVVGLDGLAAAVREVDGAIPVVAIGGIGLEGVPGVCAARADLVAVVADVIGHSDMEGRARAVHQAMVEGGAP